MSKLMALISISTLAVAACGGDDGGGTPADAAPQVPAMITVSGTATERVGTDSNPGVGVLVEAYRNGDQTPIAMATTDASGNYSIVITTDGMALDGYLKGSKTDFLDTYLYPPYALAEDFDGASVNMINQSTFDLLANTLCQADQMMTNGAIGVLVVDAAEMPVAGATIASSPAATDTCYNSGGLPSNGATMTDTDGLGYLFNVTGQATVSAMKSGSTFQSHGLNARPGALTTTVVTE